MLRHGSKLARRSSNESLAAKVKKSFACCFSTDASLSEETSKPNNIMFVGAPGVGKGTYASRIAPMLSIPTISTGDLVRKEIKENSELGQTIKKYNDEGLLVPDSIILEMVEKRLQEPDVSGGYLLDGFPRNVQQAEAFEEISDLSLVVNLSLPEWVLVKKLMGRRVCSGCGTGYNVAHIKKDEYQMPPLLPKVEGTCDKCGGGKLIQRDDDTHEIVTKRLKVYQNETAPLIDYYASKGILKSFEVKKGLADLDDLVDLVKGKME